MARSRKIKSAFNAKDGKTPEPSVNVWLAELFSKVSGWEAAAQKTSIIKNKPSLAPDIVIRLGGTAVIVEIEYEPASTLEKEVNRVIDKEINGIGQPPAIIGIVIPKKLKKFEQKDIVEELKNTKDIFQYYVQFTNNERTRFPEQGYLYGSYSDILTAIDLSAIPKSKIDDCVKIMSEGIVETSYKLKQLDELYQKRICGVLRQKLEDKTWNMAGLIVLNAGVFYNDLAVVSPKTYKPLNEIYKLGMIDSDEVKELWKEVLKKDYVPIFEVALDIMDNIPDIEATEIMTHMYRMVKRINNLKVRRSGDVYGALYQSMLGEKLQESSAAHYTIPEAATLLVGLAMPKSNSDFWNNDKELKDRIKKLRILDCACGTGMLLTAAYKHIIHNSPVDITDIHKDIIEKSIYGYDIMPTAAHLTVSNLAGLVPQEIFDDAHIYTMPIGPRSGGGGWI